MNNLSHGLKCFGGCQRVHCCLPHLSGKPGLDPREPANQESIWGRVVDLAGPRPASDGGEHAGALEPAHGDQRHSGAPHGVQGTVACEPCIINCLTTRGSLQTGSPSGSPTTLVKSFFSGWVAVKWLRPFECSLGGGTLMGRRLVTRR